MSTLHADTFSRVTTPDDVSSETIANYQRDGFAHVPGIISKAEAARFHAAAVGVAGRMKARAEEGTAYRKALAQFVNVWREDEAIRELTLHPNVAAVAEKLAGVPLRLWHDQILIKDPHNNAATEFHQDQPYWPHDHSLQPLSAWIALLDVPVERGCMSFIPGSHRRTDLQATDLTNARGLFDKCPELQWEPRVTVPLRAGDCTFHHARCAHMATPNNTDEPRVAHVVIYMDAATIFNGKPHLVTGPLSLQPGHVLEGELFPSAAEMMNMAAAR